VKTAVSGRLYRCIEFAGFAAAQVVCCLFDRQPFVPLAFSHRAPDRKTVSIISGGSPELLAARAQQWLAEGDRVGDNRKRRRGPGGALAICASSATRPAALLAPMLCQNSTRSGTS
jgi:hypothetical protein